MPPETKPTTADPAAFAKLLEGARDRVLRFLQRLCGADAEDVLQDTLARALRYRDSWDPQRNGEAWLLRTAFRLFLDWRTRRRLEPLPDEDALSRAAAAPDRSHEVREELDAGLARLSPVERAVLLGFHAERLSLLELARRHALPLNTVKSHLHRARRKLVEPIDE